MTPTEALAALRLEQSIRRARVDLAVWMEIAGPTVIGDFILADWQRDAAKHLQAFSAQLVEAERAHAAGAAAVQIRAALEVMTQAGKSEAVCRFIAWHMASTGQSTALGSFADSLSVELSRKVRALLRSGIARRVWLHLQRAASASADERDTESGEVIKDTERDWSIPNIRAGRSNTRFVARGRGGTLNGRSVWLVVLDDLIKDEMDYASFAARDEAWSFIRSSAETRVATRGGGILQVGSRWGTDDTVARYKKLEALGGHPLIVWSYPLRAKADDLMGRPVGAYLLPGWGPEREAAQRATYGARLSAAILDCAPIEDAGSTFKSEFFSRTYVGNPAEVARICDWHVLALDGAETAGAGDWSVLTWVGRRAGAYLKLGQWRQQVELPELLMLVRNAIAETRPHGTLVEVKSSGKAVYQTLSREIPGLVPVQKSRSKRDCYLAASPVFEGGSWLMPAEAQPWQQGYTERMTAITGLKDGEVDDEADADVMVILWDQERQGTAEVDPGEVLRLLRGGARR